MKEVKTTCPYCGVGCGIIATSAPDGSISIQGDPEHPSNFGRLCSKGSALAETLDLDGRLLYPQVNGQSSEWESALTHVACGFQQVIERHGPDAVAFYVSGQLLTEDYYVANKLMKGFIGSANIDTNSRLCMSSAVAAHKRAFGADIVPCRYEDIEQAQLIVLIGSNTAWCHPVLYQRIVSAKKTRPDLQVVVLDPRRTATCDLADLHLALKPGSDGSLFNGLLGYLYETGVHDARFTATHCEGLEAALASAQASAPSIQAVAKQCGLNVEEVEHFYRLFARNEHVLSLYSQGINQSSGGTDQANAIINCHLLSGRIGRAGMGPFSITGQPNAMGGREVGGLANQLVAHMALENPGHRELVQRFWQSPPITAKPGLKAVDLFRQMEQGRVKAVWIMGTNPVVSMPDADQVKAALKNCELVVVSDVMANTDTVDLAHVRLPALAWGEKSGTVSNSEHRISRQRAFLTEPGQAKNDWWIITEVAKRMGYRESFNYAGSAAIFDEYARLSAYENNGSRGLDLSTLVGMSEAEYDKLKPVQWPAGGTRPFADGRFFTETGRARLIAVTPHEPATPVNNAYPLRLNTGRVRDQWHTMTRSGKSQRLSAHSPEPYAELNPADARQMQIEPNTLVRIKSERGAIIARAQIHEGQQPGSVFVPIHWNDQFSHSARINTLFDAITDPHSGQPAFKHGRAHIEAIDNRWYGLLLSRRELKPQQPGYWSKSRGKGIWRYPLAGQEIPGDWARYARQLLCTEGSEIGWIEYFDPANHRYRAARLVDEQLESCLYIGTERELPAQGWLESLFGKDELSDCERAALLSGRAPADSADTGPIVCACFGVGKNTITKAIREEGIHDTDALGAALKAGTNCGSCVPELRSLLEEGRKQV